MRVLNINITDFGKHYDQLTEKEILEYKKTIEKGKKKKRKNLRKEKFKTKNGKNSA